MGKQSVFNKRKVEHDNILLGVILVKIGFFSVISNTIDDTVVNKAIKMSKRVLNYYFYWFLKIQYKIF